MIGSLPSSFVWLAALYGLASCLVILMLGRLAGRSLIPWLPVIASVSFFFWLTQHPLPDPAQMTCPNPDVAPRLVPFLFLDTLADHLSGRNTRGLRDIELASALMNFVLCMIIGATLIWRGVSQAGTVLAGAALSLFIETTQLTGTWGIFPCAYRVFDVDDLILNIGGVAAGAVLTALIRHLIRRH